MAILVDSTEGRIALKMGEMQMTIAHLEMTLDQKNREIEDLKAQIPETRSKAKS